MYLRTPKRYTSKGRRRRIFSLRWWWLWLLTAVVVVIGAGIWQNRAMFQEPISNTLATLIAGEQNRVATLQAPTPTATDSPLNYLAVADAAFARGAANEAIDNYRLAAQAMPNDIDVYFRLVHLMITNRQVRPALEVAEQAINADPYSALGWAVRAMAYDWLNEPAEALPSALHAVELEPDNAIVLAILAEVYTDLGDLDAAQAAIDRALQLAPDNFIVQRNDGYLMEAGYYDYDAAIDAYRRALQAAPTQVYAAFDLARVYHYNGDYQEEVETLRQIVERNPENAAAYYQLGNAQWTILGEFEQARNTLERCTSIAPNQVDCLSDLGFLQLREGEYNLCARSYDRAIQAGSANPYDYVYGGTCHIVIDECGRATDILRQALDLTDDLDVLGDIRDGLAQCQVVITLEPTATLPAPAAATATAAAP